VEGDVALPTKKPDGESFKRSILTTVSLLLLLYAAGSPRVEAFVTPAGTQVLQEMKNPGLSRRDAEQLQRGYYEQLTGANRLNSRLWEVYIGADPAVDRRPLRETDLVVRTDDFLSLALKPGLDSAYQGQPFSTNQWAMRDREYDLVPGAGVHRIALLGQSYVMGGGVADDETFENLLERRLEKWAGKGEQSIEILNFGMGNYMPARQLVQLQHKVLNFRPDVVMTIGHQSDLSRLPSNIADALYARAEVPFQPVRELLERLDVDEATPHGEVMRRLMPYREDMYRSIQAEFAVTCRDRGIIPVWVFIPTPEMTRRDADVATMIGIARDAGFVVFDLSDIYGDDAPDLWVTKWDAHPNVEGHRRIAARLYDLLTANAVLLGRTP
jgi:hypothetical protein